jgi:hypothetical protein
VSSRLSFRQARLAVAIVGLTTVVSCSGNTTSPTPQSTPVPTTVPPEAPSSTVLLWPLAGRDGRDWVINNYVDLDATSWTQDYTGRSGSEAKTYSGHNGIDIDVPNFRWMDGGVSNVLAAASGVVTGIRDTEPDRNTSCTGSANFVQVRHADGLTAIYGHLKKGSVAVSVGQQVSAGAVLGVVGSSGCSTAPHLHFELRDAANRVVDPFRDGSWAVPPIYNTTMTLIGSGHRDWRDDFAADQGSGSERPIDSPWGGPRRWHFDGRRRCRRRDQDGHHRSDGRDFLRQSPDVDNRSPALLLVLEQAAVADSGSVDCFHLSEWGSGPDRDRDRHIGGTLKDKPSSGASPTARVRSLDDDASVGRLTTFPDRFGDFWFHRAPTESSTGRQGSKYRAATDSLRWS